MAATTTGAEKLLQAAKEQGIEVCFANPGTFSTAPLHRCRPSLFPPLSAPGTSEMHFVSALDTVWGVRAVLGLHETVCSGAADGYARLARKPALTLLHLGPGLANALANLHNARRAGSPVVNVVGDMASWHSAADPLLNMDIDALAGTVSRTVVRCATEDSPAARMAEACAAAASPAPAGAPRVATLIVPHDLSWERSPAAKPKVESNGSPMAAAGLGPSPSLSPAAQEFLGAVAQALRCCPRGKVALYLGGAASIVDGGALEATGRIASATGAVLLCENSFARLDRGAGLPAVRRLPYFPQDAADALKAFDKLILIDARRPVANFGYEGGPSALVTHADDKVWELDASDVDIPTALRFLSSAVGGDTVKPLVSCGGAFCLPARPLLPKGRLNPTSLCHIIAALQPKDAIIVDESLTSGNAYWEASRGCPPFAHLCLTGGAIGCGPPLAVGAAIAAPSRTVINFQADGSAMYSAQALWTQAREGLKVVTIVAANRAYAILKVELAKQRIAPANGPAAKALTDLGNPPIDWVSLAQGLGVAAARADTAEALAAAMKEALDRSGPTVIEAVL
jgi:acetolactate synthase-1/2/3 large subunit